MRRVSIPGALLLWAASAYGQPQQPPLSPASQRAFLDKYCVYCHNDKLKTGSMTLTALDLDHVGRSADLGEKVIRKMRVGLMPPPGMPRPARETVLSFVTSLETAIDQSAAAHPNAGRPALHRLNRIEYANSIRDLLAVPIDTSALLPPDDMSHGFDNMADVLTVSPTLMEAYIRAASKISRQAVGDPEAPALTFTYSIPRVVNQNRHVEGTPWARAAVSPYCMTSPPMANTSLNSAFTTRPRARSSASIRARVIRSKSQ